MLNPELPHRAAAGKQRHGQEPRESARAPATPPQHRTLLRAAGLRITSIRMHVFKVLWSRPDHWLHPEEIFDVLVTKGVVTNLTTVYHTIKTLEVHGVVLREFQHAPTGARTIYLLNPGFVHGVCEPPVFAICRKCNGNRVLADTKVRDQLHSLLRKHGLGVADEHMAIYLTCEQCR